MACRLVCAKPLSEPILEYSKLTPGEQTAVTSKFTHFHSRNALENAVSKMAAMLSRPQFVTGAMTNVRLEYQVHIHAG